MKQRALGIVLAVGLLAASAALAAPPPGKGKKPATTGTNCKPAVAVILTGTLAADGAAPPFTLSMNVTGANKFGQAYKKAAQPVSVSVTAATKIKRQGDTDASHLKSGDKVNVQARACKADLANGATPAPLALRVTAHPAAATTTTTTTTTP